MKSLFLALCLLFPLFASAQWIEVPGTIAPSFLNAAAAWEGKVYFTGGPQSSNVVNATYNKKVEVLNLADGTIEQIGELSVARCAISAVAHDGKIYFIGGHRWTNLVSSGVFTYDHVDIYDIEKKEFTTEHLSLSRSSGAAAVVNGKIVYAGGWHATGLQVTPTDVVDIYDPVNKKWEPAQKLSIPRGEMLEAGVVGTKMYICGGGTDWKTFTCTNRVDIYDAALNKWDTASLKLARMASSVQGVGKYLVCAGGYTQTVGKTDKVDILDTETGKWHEDKLSSPRCVMAATVLGNKAYFTGGGNLNLSTVYYNQSFHNVDVFEAKANGWSWSTMNLNKNRMAHGCAAWGNKIAVGGGWRAEQAMTTGSVEILTVDTTTSVGNLSPAETAFELSPNPASDLLTIVFPENSAAPEPAELRISDLSGQVLLREKLAPGATRQPVSLQIGQLPPGSYFLSALGDGRVIGVRRFVVVR